MKYVKSLSDSETQTSLKVPYCHWHFHSTVGFFLETKQEMYIYILNTGINSVSPEVKRDEIKISDHAGKLQSLTNSGHGAEHSLCITG